MSSHRSCKFKTAPWLPLLLLAAATLLYPTSQALAQSVEACRGPGYWGKHAGFENKKSTNQTDITIARAGGSILICGNTINGGFGATFDRGVNHKTSPIEALCSNGTTRDQLVSHLTAASLNCVANGFLEDCSNSQLFGPTVAACNSGAVCVATHEGNKEAQSACVAALACLNTGGHPVVANGQFVCGTGTCSDNGAPCTTSNKATCADPLTAVCVPASNCQDEDFSDPLVADSPSGSSKACNDANKTPCTIFGGCTFNP